MEHRRIKHLRNNRRQWQEIGYWDTHAYMGDKFEFGGFVPDWIKTQIPKLLSQVGDKNLGTIKDYPHWTPRQRKLIMGNKAFEGTRILKGRLYLYKVTFQEGDESNYGHIYRKPLS